VTGVGIDGANGRPLLDLRPDALRLGLDRRGLAGCADVKRQPLVRELASALDDPDAYAAADVAIHEVVAEAAANPVLVDVLARLAELTRFSRAVTAADRVARGCTVRAIHRLGRAIRQHDATAASEAMRDHLSVMRETANAGRWPDGGPVRAYPSPSRVRANLP
jgi:DNA-binding FadR family transcriptional regulator